MDLSVAHLVLAAAGSDIPAAPVVGVMTLGLVVAIVGHINRNQKVVAIGIAVLFLATAGMIVGAFFAYHDNANDPRPCGIPGAC